MSEEIKVGDYLRTNDGIIGKVIGVVPGQINGKVIYDNVYILDTNLVIQYKFIKKYSSNIIDLIEKNDYVNDEQVIVIDEYKEWVETIDYVYRENMIKSIVTKEQLEHIKYVRYM